MKKKGKKKKMYLTLYLLIRALLYWYSNKEKVFEEFAYRFPGG